MILTSIKIQWQSDKEKGAGLHHGLCQRLLDKGIAFVVERDEEIARAHAADSAKCVSDWGTPAFDVLFTVDQYFEFAALPEVELKVKKRVKDQGSEVLSQPFTEAAIRATPQGPSDANFNNRVEVHIPGHSLSTYNQTMLLEDSCTDALQTALNQGWRIIACCPQPDARRPDYILGRYCPDHMKEVVDGSMAERRPKDFHNSVSLSSRYDGQDRQLDSILEVPNVIPR